MASNNTAHSPLVDGLEIVVVANGFIVQPRYDGRGGARLSGETFVFQTAADLAKWIGAHYKAAHS